MPRKKKSGQSPARVPGLAADRGGSLNNVGSMTDRNMARNETKNGDNWGAGTPLTAKSSDSSGKEEIVNKMREMFSHLDPEVIYLVLAECDFRVENAMDSLLELSVAAEGAAPLPAPVSGFELAASLLYPKPQQGSTSAAANGPHVFQEKGEDREDQDAIGTHLTAEFDTLIDRELETLETRPPPFGDPFSSVPPLGEQRAAREALPELLQSSVEQSPRSGREQQAHPDGAWGTVPRDGSGTQSPVSGLSFIGSGFHPEQAGLLDFSHLTAESSTGTKPALGLGNSGRPSAFQAYKKSPGSVPSASVGGRVAVSSREEVAVPEARGTSARGQSAEAKDTLPAPSTFWNIQASEFQPPQPAFITPVALNPTVWNSQPVAHWFGHGPMQQAPLKPAATIPKSWALPAAPRSPSQSRSARLEGRVLVLLRGAPGSGKSTLARSILGQNPGGVVLSSDDFFSRGGHYCYNPSLLGDAHEWNQNRAKEAFEKGVSPIIIDNTHMQGWEMKPYVAMAKEHKYNVIFREPDTWWKFKPRELERRTKHGVPKEKIRRMLERYERHVSVDTVLCSFHKRPELSDSGLTQPPPEASLSQPSPSEAKPDLVEDPHLSLGSSKAHTQLFSSLPDVSSVGRGSAREEGLDTDSSRSNSRTGSRHGSSASLSVPGQSVQTDAPPEPDLNEAELLDASALDWELDTRSAAEDEGRTLDGERAAEFSWEERLSEQPVAFSESIGQRVRRDRTRTRQADTRNGDGAGRSEGNDAVPRNAGLEEGERAGGGVRVAGSDCVRPELLEFLGDWPTEGLEQRGQRLREGRGKGRQQEGKAAAEQDGSHSSEMEEGSSDNQEKTEFQKLLDLLQVGTSSSQKPATFSVGSGVASPADSAVQSSSEDLSQEAGSVYRGTKSPSLSGGEGVDQKTGRDTRPELLDFVADWTSSGTTPVKDTPLSPDVEALMTASNAREQEDDKLLIGRETILFTPDTITEHQSGGFEGSRGSSGTRNDPGTTSQKSETPGAMGGVEAEGGPVTTVSGGSQERRTRHNRRSGKQCKLALTFTNNSPTSPRLQPESPQASPRLSLPPAGRPAPQRRAGACTSTQTDPQDFALLWRMDRRQQTRADAERAEVRVLSADCARFQPKPTEPVEPGSPREVPYRVLHDKGTQVEEQELGSGLASKSQDLQILSRHFKLVSFDTLEDLYDMCHQDMQWTTNLLLDSGEQLFKDDDDNEEELAPAGQDGLTRESGPYPGVPMDLPNAHRETEGFVLLDMEQSEALGQYVGTEASSGDLEAHPNSERGCSAGEHQVTTQEGVAREEDSSAAEELPQAAAESSVNDLRAPGELSTGQPRGEGGTSPPLWDSNEPEAPGETERRPETEMAPPPALDSDQPTSTAPLQRVGQEGEQSEGAADLLSEDDVTRSLLVQLEEMNKREREEAQRERGRERVRASQAKGGRSPLKIQSLELKLPTELAFQLTELFGPVGIDPGALSTEDCSVQIDLNLARLLHQKWKETIKERQRLEVLSYHLLQESSVHWGESQTTKPAAKEGAPHFLIGTDGLASLSQLEVSESFPFMDHWNVPQYHVSLRDIMMEEEALQEHLEKSRVGSVDGAGKDGATLLKEKQLYSLYPTIDRHFLSDIFKDHNYSLEQTKQYLKSLLDEGPVRTVVAQDTAQRSDAQRANSNERRHKGKESPSTQRRKGKESPSTQRRRSKERGPGGGEFQDTEDPEYEDFRTEAVLQRRKQQESFSKAAEAYRQGRKDVASFYAQQGHLHGQKMKEANHRAAVQIFERVNASLLPQNVLDLHGLHVDEALYHLQRVLEEKTAEWQQGGCRPQLSVITGRGNHSQGGVARIRPAVIDYLTSHNYRFTEPKLGLVLVTLH
ncbi:NEDD4-binding protein 2 [Megalops cyprinoides]|uniref:NEDD4-binding protein 2 n=1 Tax=Megalops cyprinoides TaxID=118141 RepID=UPI001864CA26|nr:NEDD4-binding protein 2 [Megalops cyprinoides]